MQAIKRGRRSIKSGRDTLAQKHALSGARRTGGPRDLENKYRNPLSMYKLPPNDEVSLEEFEKFAVDRLRLLKMVETAKIKHPQRGDLFEAAMKKATSENMSMKLSNIGTRVELYDERRMDHVSHFILRLAYCKSEELRRWFLSQECELFRHRFSNLQSSELTMAFLKESGMEYDPIDQETKESLAPKLVACDTIKRRNEEEIMKTDFYKVNFEQAIELVRKRQVYLEKGYAYVPKTDLMTLIVGAFRAKLSAALTATSRALPNLEEDSRLLPMLGNLSKQYLGNDYGATNGTEKRKVTPGSIPQLAQESFPLCMRHTQDALAKNHHLKHSARMQYGLFLKGIGLSLEDALLFWRTEFTKSMGADKFEKNHAYNIRHNYGKEGKRADYTPFSCMKIIMGAPPGVGEDHGCPFRHFDRANLQFELQHYKLPRSGIKEIVDLVDGKHYQLACMKYFEVTHNVKDVDMALQHPNQYFEKSREVRNAPMEVEPKTPTQISKTTVMQDSPKTPEQDELNDSDMLAAMEGIE